MLGEGFILTEAEREILSQTVPKSISLINRYMNGKDIVQRSRNLFIIDLHGLQESDLVRHPSIYQRIRDRVRPIRLEMKDKQRREKWWLFGRSNQEIRSAMGALDRYIATCRTAKHRLFFFSLAMYYRMRR